ncbi:MAG: hypothetical protein HGA45_30180, partial [Chloroflexales bacterium]|nr:hypothetical protein [Chloroflexales bacterium]
KLKLEIDTGELSGELKRLSSSTKDGLQRLSIGLILAGMLIGSAIGLSFLNPVEGAIWQYIYAVVLAAFLAVLIYSAVVVWMLVRSMRPSSN